jgi:hypothetical protein
LVIAIGNAQLSEIASAAADNSSVATPATPAPDKL